MNSVHLERARAHDAKGDHDEAVNELARGTGAGDPHATRALGLRLLTGQHAPLLPNEGLRFLGEACDAGLPEAAARAAGVLAVGVRIAPNWPLALAWLARAAVGGWAPACEQLLALCDDRDLAAHAAASAAPDWVAVVRAVRLDDWRTAPPPVVRHEDPRIHAFPRFLRPEICRVLISQCANRLVPARVYDPVARRDIVIAHRSNTVATFDVEDVELVHALMQARMAAACGVPERNMESPTILHYAPGEQIREHFDFVNPDSTPDYAGEIARNGQRVITFLLYLNDDYDGGETDFPKLGVSHKGRTGEGLFFVNALPDASPDPRTLHAGRPTSRGEKWIVSQFIRSRPMR